MTLDTSLLQTKEKCERWQQQITKLPAGSATRAVMQEMIEHIQAIDAMMDDAMNVCRVYARDDTVDKSVFMERVMGFYPTFTGDRYGWADGQFDVE